MSASNDGEMLHFDGFDDAVIGVATRGDRVPIVVYAYSKCVEVLEGKGLTYEDALEFIEDNLIGDHYLIGDHDGNSWVGEDTPLIVHEMTFAEVEEYSAGWADDAVE